MNVREMVFRGEDITKLYACGECGQCYSPKNVGVQNARDIAEKCCDPQQFTCKVCGVVVPPYRTMCEKHAEQAKLRRATPIPAKDWSDPVFSDEVSGDWSEGYSSDIENLIDYHYGYGPTEEELAGAAPPLPPAYCWPCTSRSLSLDPVSLLENSVDDMHEDAGDQIVDADELCAFIEAWNAKQTCKTWYPDYSRVVVLDEARFAALLSDE
jgi:hypothetical protein